MLHAEHCHGRKWDYRHDEKEIKEREHGPAMSAKDSIDTNNEKGSHRDVKDERCQC